MERLQKMAQRRAENGGSTEQGMWAEKELGQ